MARVKALARAGGRATKRKPVARKAAPAPTEAGPEKVEKPFAKAKESVERSVDNVLGQNVMGNFRLGDLRETADVLARQVVKSPLRLARASLGFLGELGKIVAGESELAPVDGDRRFTDSAWRANPVYSATLKSYLAWLRSTKRYVSKLNLDKSGTERAQFLLAQIGDALAPTNFLLGNPAALRHARETNGMSLVRGARNLIGDVQKRRPIPAQVDDAAFEVGGNLAATPGSVVMRTEMFELIQYAPQTTQVRQRPTLVVPSIVNKYYVFDLAPGRSVMEHFVRNELTVFIMVWRSPQRRHDHWGMAEYQDAIDTAILATCAIARVDAVNLWAVCGAGPVAVALAGHYAATRKRRINSLLLVVSPLDMQEMEKAPGIGAFAGGQAGPVEMSVKKKLRNRRITANEFTLLFAMLRANDLIWSYWVSNYLMGKSPSAFDVMYWNGDGTGMTAQFNSDFSEFVEDNPFLTPGAMKVRGKPIADISKLGFDSYVLGAATDHLCLWQGVYRSAQLLGERSQFVLGNSGHVQTIVCPPGNPKASFNTNDHLPGSAEEWLQSSTRHAGSWWDHGVAWTIAHAGELVRAPKAGGNKKHPPLCAAPGTYVHERG